MVSDRVYNTLLNKIRCLLPIIFLFTLCPSKRHFYAPVLLEYRIVYPDIARQLGLEGEVLLAILVNEKGRVEQVRLLKSSSNTILDSAALETAQTFLFSPALIGDKPVRIWVNLPVEFKFEEIKPDVWLSSVRELQKTIDRKYKESLVMDLYKLYKKLIFSPRKTIELKVNDYIKLAVREKAAQLWAGYWDLYPALPVLFFDIIYQYPHSYARFVAEEEFKGFFEQEKSIIRNSLPQVSADTIIIRLSNALGNL
ncbi:MAG: energy transducer TonB [candidate division WOR-3 bacterium]|nr:energy transducer TonB [candidate division WOR-3 bacterium]